MRIKQSNLCLFFAVTNFACFFALESWLNFWVGVVMLGFTVLHILFTETKTESNSENVRKSGVPSRQAVYKLLKARSLQLQGANQTDEDWNGQAMTKPKWVRHTD